MHKISLSLILISIFFLVAGCTQTTNTNEVQPTPSGLTEVARPETEISPIKATQPDEPKTFTPFTAKFEIVTFGTTRIFTNAMYHYQSPQLYIEAPDPSIIQVKQPNATWQDFFATLPFSLSKECLVTGTNQTFCTTATQQLRFYLNGEETPNALEYEIKPDDYLQVKVEAVR